VWGGSNPFPPLCKATPCIFKVTELIKRFNFFLIRKALSQRDNYTERGEFPFSPFFLLKTNL
jgi:hypothetical protein